jgi:hypothetical protein
VTTYRQRSELEESALRTLIAALEVRGFNVVDVGCPELDPSDPLNIDARLNIDGDDWAVEHCRIVHDPEKIAAERYAEESLFAFGNQTASEYGIRIMVGFYLPRWPEEQKPPIAFFERIKERIRVSAQSGTNDRDSECQIYVSPGDPAFEFSFFSTDDPLIRNQLLKGLKVPLLKKQDKQFLPAR